MKKTLEKIRSKPAEVRMAIAVGLAVFCTALIAVGWGMTLVYNAPAKKPKAPSPLNALTGAIKDVVTTPSGLSKTPSNTQIIDASDPLHDESNPYQQ